ncbi:MAG: discoidin domain-containing protein [Armatimonadota bacterium]
MSMRIRIIAMVCLTLAACIAVPCAGWALTNIALTGTASASAVFADDPTYGADKANDGLGWPDTRWSGWGSGTEWWQVEWSAPQVISQVVISNASINWPMTLQAWNSATSSFDIIASADPLAGWADTTFDVTPVTTTIIRCQDVLSLWEVQVYGEAAPVPEPASLMGLILGVFSLGIARRRR